MSQAAIPKYLGRDFRSASPALRFGMYFSGWTDCWEKDKNDETMSKTWQDILHLNSSDRERTSASCDRQMALFKHVPPASGLEMSAISVSPFATGLGMEHPLENGFAFLNPHGLPYLPGSGRKGRSSTCSRGTGARRSIPRRQWLDAASDLASVRFRNLAKPTGALVGRVLAR